MLLGPPKTEAQLKKEAKKREKLEKFQQKKEMEAKKKMQPVAEVWRFHVTSNATSLNNVTKHICCSLIDFCHFFRKRPNLKRENWE